VKIKPLSWDYVLHILNGEAASITFDGLFKMTIQTSREDTVTQVFTSVLQNEALQDELFNLLKIFAQMCIGKVGVLPLQELELAISSDIMETSGLKAEFESLMEGEYGKVRTIHTIPDSIGECQAYLTVLVDAVQISEILNSNGANQSLENCRDQHTPHATSWGNTTTIEELQLVGCPTPVTSTTNGTASKGSKDPHVVEHINKKSQVLRKDPGIEDDNSNAIDGWNHGNRS